MITGAHVMLYSREADRVRSFFKDILQFQSVDAGHGWLILALPPAELAVHPVDEAGHHELYLMCDDIHATVEMLNSKGVEISAPIADQGWGISTRLQLPGGDQIGLYQPRHASPLQPR